jgi:hypothetical protein
MEPLAIIVGIILLLIALTTYLTTKRKEPKSSNPKLVDVSFGEFKATLWQIAFIQTFTTTGIILTTLGLIL